jgi:hypothetical protein
MRQVIAFVLHGPNRVLLISLKRERQAKPTTVSAEPYLDRVTQQPSRWGRAASLAAVAVAVLETV